MEKDKIIKYLSEILMLKRLKHEGVKLAGIEVPDSLADHITISTQIAYLLGEMEGADSSKCVLMNLFHDNEECRLGDLNKVNARYINIKEAEKSAREDHFSNLPENMAKKVLPLLEEKEKRDTKEGIIAQDADWLEVAIQAKIYTEIGYDGCKNWIENVEKALETESAKEILKEIKENPDFLNYWWQGLKKMTYKKLDKDK